MSTDNSNAFDRVTEALREYGCHVDERGDRATAQAPGHSPADRSIALRRESDRVLMSSFADPIENVLADLGLRFADLYDEPRTPGGALPTPRPPSPEQVEQRRRRAELDAAHRAEYQRNLAEADRVAAEYGRVVA